MKACHHLFNNFLIIWYLCCCQHFSTIDKAAIIALGPKSLSVCLIISFGWISPSKECRLELSNIGRLLIHMQAKVFEITVYIQCLLSSAHWHLAFGPSVNLEWLSLSSPMTSYWKIPLVFFSVIFLLTPLQHLYCQALPPPQNSISMTSESSSFLVLLLVRYHIFLGSGMILAPSNRIPYWQWLK